jgi:hypothetical protein
VVVVIVGQGFDERAIMTRDAKMDRPLAGAVGMSRQMKGLQLVHHRLQIRRPRGWSSLYLSNASVAISAPPFRLTRTNIPKSGFITLAVVEAAARDQSNACRKAALACTDPNEMQPIGTLRKND